MGGYDVGLSFSPHYSPNVSHEATEPESSPLLNHDMRCWEVPCVNESGETWPVDIF
jgi:hypothetical protein